MTFTIESERYVAMKDSFEAAADIIRRAINSERQIIIRHHCDCDGILAGIVLEDACKQLMIKALVKPHFNLFRSSCKAPYYAFDDFVKDLNTIKRSKSRGGKAPLLIILDNGSTDEDYFGIKCLHDSGVEVIVVDHHVPTIVSEGVSRNCQFLKAHINPHLFGYKSEICAGMLSFELSNLLVPNNNFFGPAVSGLDDRVEGEELDFYISKTGKSRQELLNMGVALDYLIFSSRFDLDSSTYEEVFYNSDLVSSIIEKLEEMTEAKLKTIRQSLDVKEIGRVKLVTLDVENYSEKFDYPRTGKITELVLDEYESAFVMSLVGNSITIRQSEVFVSVGDLISKLQEILPFANVKGGGHAVAGTLSFVRAYQKEVLDSIKDILSKC